MKKALLCLYVSLLSFMAAHSQVINVESYRIRTDTTGWAGSGDLSLYLAKYDETVLTFLTNIQIQYKNDRSLFLMLTDVATVQADKDAFISSGFQHFRYNYKITDKFVWEAFVQGQYNEPLAIEYRLLAGTGPRYKLIGTDQFRLYAAALYMFEQEKNTGVEDPANLSRLDAYVSFTLSSNENYTLTSTTYYQPAFSDFNDYRLSTALNLKTYFGKFGYMKFKYSLQDDKAPAEGVPNTTYTLMGGLGLEF